MVVEARCRCDVTIEINIWRHALPVRVPGWCLQRLRARTSSPSLSAPLLCWLLRSGLMASHDHHEQHAVPSVQKLGTERCGAGPMALLMRALVSSRCCAWRHQARRSAASEA